MKKHVKLFLLSALIVALAGCSTVKNTEKNNDENEIKEPTEIIANSGEEKNTGSFKKIYGGEPNNDDYFAYWLLEDEDSEQTEWKAEEKTLAGENLLLNSKFTDVKVLLNKTIKIKDEGADTGEHIVGNFVLDIDGKTFDGDCIYLGTGSEGGRENIVDLNIIKSQDNIDYILITTHEPGFIVEGTVYAYIYNTSGTLLKKQLIANRATGFSYKDEALIYEISESSIIYYEQDWKIGIVNKYELSLNNNEVHNKFLKSYSMSELDGAGALT